MADDVFVSGHYATTFRERVKRGFELGPKYYAVDLPRYFSQRRKLKLPVFDWRALINPIRSFRNNTYVALPLPPHFDEALDLLGGAGIRFDNPRSRIEALASLWWDVRGSGGDAIECGAYRGATSIMLALLGQLNGLGQKVMMLDTFDGMPPPSEFDSSRQGGELKPPQGWPDVIRTQLRELGLTERVQLYQGLFAETFPELLRRDARFSFAHIDANIYEGTFDACRFTLPNMVAGGAVVFDDYNGLMDLGARLAIDSYLSASGQRPQPLAECSAYLRT
jgi:hypothetical protein